MSIPASKAKISFDMSNPIIHIKGASIISCAAIPSTAILCNERNYKAEVLKELQSLAYNEPVRSLAFNNITPKAKTFLEKMASAYSLEIYYKTK